VRGAEKKRAVEFSMRVIVAVEKLFPAIFAKSFRENDNTAQSSSVVRGGHRGVSLNIGSLPTLIHLMGKYLDRILQITSET